MSNSHQPMGTDWINLKLIERHPSGSSSQTATDSKPEYVFRVELDTVVSDRTEAMNIRGLLLGADEERKEGIELLKAKRKKFLLKLFIEMALGGTATSALPDVTDPRFALVEDLRKGQEGSEAAAIVECGVTLTVDDADVNKSNKTTKNVREKLKKSAKDAATFVSANASTDQKAAFELIK